MSAACPIYTHTRVRFVRRFEKRRTYQHASTRVQMYNVIYMYRYILCALIARTTTAAAKAKAKATATPEHLSQQVLRNLWNIRTLTRATILTSSLLWLYARRNMITRYSMKCLRMRILFVVVLLHIYIYRCLRRVRTEPNRFTTWHLQVSTHCIMRVCACMRASALVYVCECIHHTSSFVLVLTAPYKFHAFIALACDDCNE